MKRTAFLLALAPMAACAPVPPDTAPPPADGRQCDARSASTLVGQRANAESGAQALRLSGAGSLRWGPPRSAFTMDYSPMRVNVMYDDAMTITEVTCG